MKGQKRGDGGIQLSPAVADSEPGGKLESWLWWETPAHKGGAEPSVSARK